METSSRILLRPLRHLGRQFAQGFKLFASFLHAVPQGFDLFFGAGNATLKSLAFFGDSRNACLGKRALALKGLKAGLGARIRLACFVKGALQLFKFVLQALDRDELCEALFGGCLGRASVTKRFFVERGGFAKCAESLGLILGFAFGVRECFAGNTERALCCRPRLARGGFFSLSASQSIRSPMRVLFRPARLFGVLLRSRLPARPIGCARPSVWRRYRAPRRYSKSRPNATNRPRAKPASDLV